MNELHFAAISVEAGTTQVQSLAVRPTQLVIAGWTGRNAEAIEHHIVELEALGVPVPLPCLCTTAPADSFNAR